MTNKNKNKNKNNNNNNGNCNNNSNWINNEQRQKQVPFGDDKQEMQKHAFTAG